MMCSIEKGKLEALLAYLLTRPYGEVENAVQWVREALATQSADESNAPILVTE